MADAKKGLAARLKAIGGKVWDELAPAAGHGSSEVAAALFTGSAFVMYPRGGPEPPEPEPPSLQGFRAATREAARADDDGRGGDEPERGREM